LARDNVLTPTGTIQKPRIELLCQWIKMMAMVLSRSESKDLRSAVYLKQWMGG
jgi:hypothetical protein